VSQPSLEDLFRQGDPGARVSAQAVRRVAARIAATPRRRSGSRIGFRRIAVPAALLLGVPAAVAAVFQSVAFLRSPEVHAPPKTELRHPPAAIAPRAQPPVDISPPLSLEPAPPRAVRRLSRPVNNRPGVALAVNPAPAPLEAKAPAPEESGWIAESRLLKEAQRALHERNDPGAALKTLDAFGRQFPQSALANEAALARVDADLALGRRDAALDVLGALEGGGEVPRAFELRLLHGELLAEKGRCTEALPYFARELASPRSDLRERALYGRALCTGNRADLTRYLEDFPSGRFAAAARAALSAE
jgi:hypothetical protein